MSSDQVDERVRRDPSSPHRTASAGTGRLDRPRVLVVTPVFPPARGGIETLTEAIVDGLRPWTVDVVTLVEPGSKEWDQARGIRVWRAANRPRGGRRSLMRLNLLMVLHAVRRRPTVVLNMYVRTAVGATWVRRLTGARWVQYYHAKEVPLYPKSARRAARGADAQVAVSRYTAGLVMEAGAASRSVHVIPPCGPQEVAGDLVGRPAAVRPTVLTVSRLDDQYKGHDVMLAAMPRIIAAVPGVQWVVVGTGALAEQFAAEVAAAGVSDHVEILGAVSDDERDRLLRSAHVFVLPSRVPPDGRGGEGFGIVYLEAAAAGLPVVCGRSGGSVDAVEDADAFPTGGTGLLVDPSDSAAVAAAVIRLLTDTALIDRIKARGPVWAHSFSVERLVRELRPILAPDRR